MALLEGAKIGLQHLERALPKIHDIWTRPIHGRGGGTCRFPRPKIVKFPSYHVTDRQKQPY